MAVEDGGLLALVKEYWGFGFAAATAYGGWVGRGVNVANRLENLESANDRAEQRLAALERLVATQTTSAAVIQAAVASLGDLPAMISDLRAEVSEMRGEIRGRGGKNG